MGGREATMEAEGEMRETCEFKRTTAQLFRSTGDGGETERWGMKGQVSTKGDADGRHADVADCRG